TGVDSTRVMIRNNTLRNCGKQGVKVNAVGDVTIAGNTLANVHVGVSLSSGASGALRPQVSGNLIERSGLGIGARYTSGGMIAQNTVRPSPASLSLVNSDGLAITSNEFDGGGKVSGANLEIADNIFRGNVRID